VIRSEQLAARINGDVTVSDDAIHDYYEEHKSEYPPTRDVQYILVGKNKAETADDLKAQGQDPKKDKDAAKKVAAAYDDPEKVAKQVYAELRKGAKFAALAKKYSQDESTKNSGGKLTATKGQVVPLFWKNVAALKTNKVGEPFETPEFGWFVVKPTGPVKEQTEKDVAETIRQQLLSEKSNEAYTDWSKQLAANVCKQGRIAYQIGYTPNPDPCAPYNAAATATTP
jgi:parvulin-like peptidyl-prolyl isomerase